MRQSIGLLVFALAWLCNLTGLLTGVQWLANWGKPGIVIGLLIYVFQLGRLMPGPLKKWLLAALLLSLAGDVLLIFEPWQPIFFMLGLGSFLLAQTCYIVLFLGVKKSEQLPWKPIWILAAGIYLVVLMYLLLPLLGALKIPVLVYALVIGIMAAVALHFFQPRAGYLTIAAAGAVSFIGSDSLLAINKFYYPFFQAGFFIMFTYGLAQALIAIGITKHFKQLAAR